MPYRNVSIRLSCAFLMECACALMSPHFAAAAGQAPSYQGKDDAANRAAEIQTVPNRSLHRAMRTVIGAKCNSQFFPYLLEETCCLRSQDIRRDFVGPSGQVTITPSAGEATTTLQQAAAQCKPPSGANSQPVPTTIGEALNEIDTNGADQCHDQHVSELAYGLIARSDALCRSYVGTLSFDQRSYRTILV